MVGTVTISVEIELGWGYHDIDSGARYSKLSKRRQRETETLDRFLGLLDEYEIPVSFDVVGHLFLESCSGCHEGEYPNGWFSEDPGTNHNQDPLFYAPDLVDAIESVDTNHEICTHTFSHVLCDEISERTLEVELESVQKLHRERLGEEPVSLVTPRHRDVSYSTIQDSGIEIVRVPTDDLPDGRPSRFFWYLFGSHPVKGVTRNEGIFETHTSTGMSLTAHHLPTGQTQPHLAFRIIPEKIRQRLHKRYLHDALEQACQQDSNIHLWTHLHDMANDSQWSVISTFLQTLDEATTNRRAQVATMADLVMHEN